MKFFFVAFLILSLGSSAFAFTDTGLLGAKKTIGGFWLSDTSTFNLSSGLLYNEKLSDNSEWKISYTSYRSVYFLTRNVTQLTVMRKYPLIGFGPVAVGGLVGLGGYYSPAVGGGVTGNGGVEFVVSPAPNLSVSMPLYMSLFSDGFWMNVLPSVNFQPSFLPGYELFVGGRVDAMMMGSPGSSSSSSSGKMNMYFALGLRRAI